LAGQTAKWFAQWLSLGLEDYLFERGGRKAFPGAENFVDQPVGSIAGDLMAIADCLAPRDRAAFRQGIVIGLRELDFANERDVVVAVHLLELGCGLTAPEVIRTIAEKVYTIPCTEDGRKLFRLAFDAADQLAPNEPGDVVLAIRHMVARETLFDPTLAGRALVAMTAAEPHNFADHFDFLRVPLGAQYRLRSLRDPSEEVVARQRRRLIRNVAAKLINENLLAYPCRPDGEPRPEERNWWLEALSSEKPELLPLLERATEAEAAGIPIIEDTQAIILDASGLGEGERVENAYGALGAAERDIVDEACEEECLEAA
jgi:hypothetical protein